MNVSDFSLLSIVITSGLAAFLLIYTAKRTANYVFVLLVSCFAVFSLAELLMRGSPTADQGFFWGRIGFSLTILIGSVLVHFALVFPRRFFLERRVLVFRGIITGLYAFGFFLILVFNSVVTAQSIEIKPWGYRIGITVESWFAVVWIIVCSLVALSLFLVAYFRRPNTAYERRQIGALFFGILVLLLAKVAAQSLPDSLFEVMLPMTTVSFAFFVGIVTYALFRYRLFIPTLAETAEAVVKTMVDGLLVIDENEAIVQVNDAALKSLGYEEREMLGRPLSTILKGTSVTGRVLDQPAFSRLTSGQMRDVELTFISRNGTFVPMNVSASQIFTKNRKLEGTVIVTRDLSETKRLIAELAVAKNLLEVKVEARTRELFDANLELQKEIAVRKGTESNLLKSLQEKDFLLKEIHHRVKNNLQIISSILDLQAGTISEPPALNVFKESQNRIKSMALVHEQLYQSHDFTSVDFEQYLQSLSVNLFHSLGINTNDVHLEISAPSIRLSIDDSISCGFIINELIMNSFKHAFPNGRKGTISISFNQTDDGFYTLIVRDDGIGFPENINFKETNTLGLQLVNILVTQLKGTITLSRDNGTIFTIKFPQREQTANGNPTK